MLCAGNLAKKQLPWVRILVETGWRIFFSLQFFRATASVAASSVPVSLHSCEQPTLRSLRMAKDPCPPFHNRRPNGRWNGNRQVSHTEQHQTNRRDCGCFQWKKTSPTHGVRKWRSFFSHSESRGQSALVRSFHCVLCTAHASQARPSRPARHPGNSSLPTVPRGVGGLPVWGETSKPEECSLYGSRWRRSVSSDPVHTPAENADRTINLSMQPGTCSDKFALWNWLLCCLKSKETTQKGIQCWGKAEWVGKGDEGWGLGKGWEIEWKARRKKEAPHIVATRFGKD